MGFRPVNPNRELLSITHVIMPGRDTHYPVEMISIDRADRDCVELCIGGHGWRELEHLKKLGVTFLTTSDEWILEYEYEGKTIYVPARDMIDWFVNEKLYEMFSDVNPNEANRASRVKLAARIIDQYDPNSIIYRRLEQEMLNELDRYATDNADGTDPYGIVAAINSLQGDDNRE